LGCINSFQITFARIRNPTAQAKIFSLNFWSFPTQPSDLIMLDEMALIYGFFRRVTGSSQKRLALQFLMVNCKEPKLVVVKKLNVAV